MTKVMTPECIICHGKILEKYFYPPNHFNHKDFNYYKCHNCTSVSIFPIPDDNDFKVMYSTDNHKEILEVDNLNALYNPPSKTYQYYQLQFLKNFIEENNFSEKTLLDYGCGNGFYLNFAKKLGINHCIGVEYDPEFTKIISKKSGLNIIDLKSFEVTYKYKKFDLIHLGHVLEHHPAPDVLMKLLIEYAHEDTFFIIDGPLEINQSLSRTIINFGSKLKRKEKLYYEPQHLTFTNYQSQLRFFEQSGLKTIKYQVVEQYWPLPNKFSISGNGLKYLLAELSIQLSKLNKKSGNVFHYIGKV